MIESETSPQTSQETVDTLIATARDLQPSQSAISGLSESLPPGEKELSELLSTAVERYEDKAFTHLLFAVTLARKLGDPWMLADAGEPSLGNESLYGCLVDLADVPPLRLFNKTAPRVVHSGSTMRRAVPHIGRNEPCPCGSGKKYKRCCYDKDQERLRNSSGIAGVTSEEIETHREQYLTAQAKP